MARKAVTYCLLFLIVVLATLPLISTSAQGAPFSWIDAGLLSGLNFCAWVLVLVLLVSREETREMVNGLSRSVGFGMNSGSLEEILQSLIYEVERKHRAFLPSLIEDKVSSKEQLAGALERIVANSYKLFDAESVELALIDEESGFFHSSFVLGKPFSVGAQAMLSTTLESGSAAALGPGVIAEPIAFAGSILGSLRIARRQGQLPTSADKELAKILALLSGIVIVNAHYTEELVRMKKASEESVQAKTGFLANLSHEIRGPLGIILNAVELVLDGLCGELNEDQRETLQMVRSNSDHLLELINDVLDYAKAESGKIVPVPTEILLNEFLHDIAQIVRTQADAKGHKLIVTVPEEPLAFKCDRRHARQMMINLLTNAIKYTPTGGTIVVWGERVPGNKVKILVKDTGVGIAGSERDKVFAAFERIENSYSIQQIGTGLGMPLTKRLIEVNNGVVDFESEPGKGSTFWLVVPSVPYDPFMKGDEKASEPEARGHGEVIVLFEHEKHDREMMRRYLNHLGFVVVEGESKSDVITLIGRHRARLVIAGALPPGESEEEFFSLVRGESPHPVRLLFVSSRVTSGDVEQYLRWGVDRCLLKPASLKTLGHTCRELVDSAVAGSRLLKKGEGEAPASVQTSTKRNDDIVH